MINEVYSTVLSVLNKNNYGYLSPGDFNLFAKQAQLDIFEDFFYSYNYQLNKENARVSGTGYADIKKGIEENISIFSVNTILTQSAANLYSLPADYYFIDKLYYYPTQLFNGTTTATLANHLVDAAGGFTASTVVPSPAIGSIVVNTTDSTTAYVTAVNSATDLTMSQDIMATTENYIIYQATNITQVEKVEQNKIFNLTSSNLTAPTTQFPAYVLGNNLATVYPSTINQAGAISCQYIRYPLDPKWTYTMVTNTPLFNGGAADYQNFEVPQDNMNDLIMRILKYAGVQIREADIANFAMTEITAEKQNEK